MTYPVIYGYNRSMENTQEQTKSGGKGGRPSTVGASVKTTILVDPDRMAGLNALAAQTQRSRNSLLREAIDDLLKKQVAA